MCDHVKLSFEGTDRKAIFKAPYTMERLVAKAALILKISQDQFQTSFEAVYVDEDAEEEIVIVDDDDLEHAVS